jgi:hypothetical protein
MDEGQFRQGQSFHVQRDVDINLELDFDDYKHGNGNEEVEKMRLLMKGRYLNLKKRKM